MSARTPSHEPNHKHKAEVPLPTPSASLHLTLVITLMMGTFTPTTPAGTLLSAPPSNPVTSERLTPVEPALADIGPRGISQRIMALDRRKPTDFDRIFRVTSDSTDPNATAPMFARKSGGLTAVFPRSQYRGSGGGSLTVELPADTRFIIGESSPLLHASHPKRAETPSLRTVSRLVPALASSPVRSVASTPVPHDPAPVLTPSPSTDETPSPSSTPGMLTNDFYRIRRVTELLKTAVAAEARISASSAKPQR